MEELLYNKLTCTFNFENILYLGSRSFCQPYKKLVKACSRAEGINKVTVLKEKRKWTKSMAGYG